MRTIDYYRKRRKIAIIALGGECAECGWDKCLEIDHIDPATKTINLGTDWYNVGWWQEVLTKCQLLCKPCHIKKSSAESSVRMLAKGFTHGTTYGWMKTKCKCDICQAAKDTFNQNRRLNRRSDTGRGEYNQPTTHGTKLMYSRGCKCPECKAANSEHARQYRLRKQREQDLLLFGEVLE